MGVQAALELGAESLTIVGDSMLVIMQLRGKWSVQAGNLAPYKKRINQMLRKLPHDLRHVLRGQNKAADRLANLAMDSRTGSRRVFVKSAPAVPSRQVRHRWCFGLINM